MTCPKDLCFLRPVIVEELCGVGNLSNGGYATSWSTIERLDTLLSFGLGKNWSFEKAFLDRKKCIN